MTPIEPFTEEQVWALPYVELLALLGESNRPPGGFDSIRRLIQNCHLGPHLSVLHAGCNAGFLSREIARLAGCRVCGIDLSAAMANAANARAHEEGLQDLVRFENRDMRDMKFETSSFDVTLSGGALAFVDGQDRAVDEWVRVTKPHGLVADVELFYRNAPPESLRKRVSQTIGVDVPEYSEAHWRKLFGSIESLVEYHAHTADMIVPPKGAVRAYTEKLVAYRAGSWTETAQRALTARLEETFLTFNENLEYMGYILLVYRRLPVGQEPILYV